MKRPPALRRLPAVLTSYDLLKAWAVIIMIADHVGYYFYPDSPWFRAIGRTGFPVWFFLVGYARARDVPPRLAIGAVILVLADMAVGMTVFPVNALGTIILIRVTIEPLMRLTRRGWPIMLGIAVILCFGILPTFALCEYGTQALITAMFGYAARQQHAAPEKARGPRAVMMFYAALTCVSFIVTQQYIFQFAAWPLALMTGGTAATIAVLYHFRSKNLRALTRRVPIVCVWLIQFMGRRTLEIYVFHLVLFKALGVWREPARFVLGHWKWYSATGR